jgi:hypothetical protein
MGKERKPGLVVVALLTLILSVLLVRRLAWTADEAAAAPSAGTFADQGPSDENRDAAGDQSAASGTTVVVCKPTLLTPAAVSSTAAVRPPEDPAGDALPNPYQVDDSKPIYLPPPHVFGLPAKDRPLPDDKTAQRAKPVSHR